MQSKEQSEKRGDIEFKEGMDYITTSLFRWSKDYPSGTSHFNQALKHYQTAGCYDKCENTLRQLIICNQKNMDNWAVGRNYEELVDLYVDKLQKVDLEVLKQTTITGFINFRMSDSLDKGLQLISKVARFLLQTNRTKQGMALLQDAYKSAMSEQKSYRRQDIFNQIVDVYMSSGFYLEAERIYRQEINFRKGIKCSQLGLIILILILVQNEPKRAQQEMYELSNVQWSRKCSIPQFLTSDDCEAADDLIKCYKKGEAEQFKKVTTKAAITCIFPISVCQISKQIIRKLRELTVPTADIATVEPAQQQKIIKDLLY